MFYPIGFIYIWHPLHHGYLKLYQVLLYETKARGFILHVGPKPMGFYGTRQQGM